MPTTPNIQSKALHAGHTPGPWIAEIDAKSCECTIRGVMDGDRQRKLDGTGDIATIDLRVDGQWDGCAFAQQREDMLANAHLIAAAPDLLKALGTLLRDYECLLESGDCGNGGTVSDYPEIKQTHAAIAKASAP